jgi:hypothetical protein
MKTSWVIGLIMLWLLIFTSEMMVTGASVFNPTDLNAVNNVTIQNGSNIVSTAWTVFTNLGTYAKGILKVILLYEPSVFAGNYIWFWYLVCLPIDIGILFSIVSVFRGVHAS